MDKKVITFREGIPGFEELREFVLLEEENSEFYYLQSVEREEICFVVMNPHVFVSDYKPSISEAYFAKLGGGATDEFALYTILTVGKSVEDTMVNLKAPVLIHVERREGVQVIIEDKQYKGKTELRELVKEWR